MSKTIKGWVPNPTSGKNEYQVYNASNEVKTIFDEDAAVYQGGTKVTASAAELNRLVGTDFTPTMINNIAYNRGTQAFNILNQSGVVVDTETITIGAGDTADVFEVEQVNTDTTKTTTSALTAVQTNIPIQTGHGVEAGDVILIGTTEFCLVTAAAALELTVIRGWGLTAATHETGAAVFKGAGYTATRIPVPMQKTTLTAEAFINHFVSVHARAKALGTLKASSVLTASKQSAALMALIADDAGASTLATTETFTNGAFRSATLTGGSAAGAAYLVTWEHTVTAQDATNTTIHLYTPAKPRAIMVQVRQSTGVPRTWNGAVSWVNTAPRHIKLDNTGATNWADTDVITVVAMI